MRDRGGPLRLPLPRVGGGIGSMAFRILRTRCGVYTRTYVTLKATVYVSHTHVHTHTPLLVCVCDSAYMSDYGFLVSLFHHESSAVITTNHLFNSSPILNPMTGVGEGRGGIGVVAYPSLTPMPNEG